ncbi:MAG: LTA synthase family protein [Lachnospiraceae bacterium]|nr:LTA synthase family protein [Lachnospiraceae bacterium]
MTRHMKKILKAIIILLSFIILLVGAFSIFTALWVRRTWTKLSAGSIIFQLQNSLEGTGAGMVKTFILSAVVPAIITLITGILIFIFIKKRNLFLLLSNVLGIGLFACSLLLLWNRIGLGNYIKYMHKSSTFIEDNYVSPDSVKITFPENKRNVIYIYLESMELTYADYENGGAMPESLIPNLTSLAYEDGEYFGSRDSLNGAYSMYGTDWTMGAMFAETAGLPLIIPIQKNSMFTQDKFFPTVTTFGDILAENGYKNVFLIGSDAEFGGRDIYYSTHGNYEIEDYNYAKNSGRIPQDYMVFWGYEDEKLFSFAKEELDNLSAGLEPFNLTLLTVDTHFEDGYTCHLCEDRYDNPYANVISCSDRQVADFVEWCKTQDFYDNTTIIISGDHPTMDTDFCAEIDTSYDRRVYISIINPAEEARSSLSYDNENINTSDTTVESDKTTASISREYTTFDLFPTSLAAMGVDIEGDRLGLGTNLYSDKPTLLETYGFEEFNTQLMMKSDFMTKLADIDATSADAFLDDVDDKLSSMDVELSIEETAVCGQYKINAVMLSDNPSSLNYIKLSYVTLSDGTYNYSTVLKYDNDYSISEGKTCYTAYAALPLTEDKQPDFHDETGPFATDKPDQTTVTESPTISTPFHWKGNITVSLTIETHNDTSFSNWSKDFTVEY